MRYPEDVPVLTDGAVALRAHRTADVDGVVEQGQDPLSQRWTTVPAPYTRAHAEHFVGRHVPAGWHRGQWAFAVEARDDAGTPRFAGTVELRDEGNRRAEIAFGSAPWARGRGVVARSLALLLDWGFAERGLRVVSWWAGRGNWASRRTAWRLGFSCDATVRRWLAQRGDLVDAWVGVLHVDDAREPRRPWLPVPRLVGERVVLRPLAEADAPRVVEAMRDDSSALWLPQPEPYGLEHALDWMLRCGEETAAGTGVTWAVADADDDRVVGSIGATGLHPARGAEVGWWTHPADRHRGLATEACGLLVRHALASSDEGGMGLPRLHVNAGVANRASWRVAEANGFTRVGVERRSLRLGDGTLSDRVTYDLLAGER